MSAAQAPNKPLSIPLQLPIPRTDKPQTYSLKISDPSTASIKQQSFNLSIPNITNLSSISNLGCPSPTKRIKGISCSKSIIYGNITHQLDGTPDYSAIRPATNSNSSFDSNRNNNSYDTQEWFRSAILRMHNPQNTKNNKIKMDGVCPWAAERGFIVFHRKSGIRSARNLRPSNPRHRECAF